MKGDRRNNEPLCETSEKGEKLFTREELVPVGLEIGRRLLEIFGYQRISTIVFRLRSTADEVNAIVNGEKMPSVELLLSVHQITGASIDWLLTGKGNKYIADDSHEPVSKTLRIQRHLRGKRVTALKQHAR